jgi:ABC-type antimicrobial peptide transport system permease subunit
LNEEAVKKTGIKDPIGKIIKVQGKEKEIIGVTKNFNFESFYEELKPCIVQLEPRAGKILVKVAAGKEKDVLANLENLYRQKNPGLPFEYTFLNESYQLLYESERRISILSQCFAALAVLISCLGLFGLAAFTAERRRKEIGVRKVLGSSVSQIVLLLSKDF